MLGASDMGLTLMIQQCQQFSHTEAGTATVALPLPESTSELGGQLPFPASPTTESAETSPYSPQSN